MTKPAKTDVSEGKHTPLPWRVETSKEECFILSAATNPESDGHCLISDMYRGGYDYEEFGYTHIANAALIVKSVNAYPRLEAMEKALQAIIADAPDQKPESNSDAFGYVSDDPDDHFSLGAQTNHWRLAEIARAALKDSGATP